MCGFEADALVLSSGLSPKREPPRAPATGSVKVLLHFGNDVQRLWNIEPFTGDPQGRVNGWLLPFRKFDVDGRADNL